MWLKRCKLNLYVIVLFCFLFLLFRLEFSRYIPTTYFYRYLPIELEMNKFGRYISLQNTNRKNLSLFLFVFINFLVVILTNFLGILVCSSQWRDIFFCFSSIIFWFFLYFFLVFFFCLCMALKISYSIIVDLE